MRPSGTTAVASNVTAPTPRVTKLYRTRKDQYKPEPNSGGGEGESGTYPDVNEMPVSRMSVIRAILTHRSH